MTKIEWTHGEGYKGETWNPLVGCSLKSPGCQRCYAMGEAYRKMFHPNEKISSVYAGVATRSKAGQILWTGKVNFSESALTKPLHWRMPRMIFVNSMSDLFHEDVPDEWIDRIVAVMLRCPQHIFQILTKRSQRMMQYVKSLPNRDDQIVEIARKDGATLMECKDIGARIRAGMDSINWIWLGVSVEDQKHADARIPDLLATPAAVRFLSCEPLLGQLDIERITLRRDGQKPNALSKKLGDYCQPLHGNFTDSPKIDWVIVGGESGKGARPIHPDWARTIRDQCAEANVPFFFKQWGSWLPYIDRDNDDPDWRADYGRAKRAKGLRILNLEGGCGFHGDRVHIMQRRNKKAAGRLLDGQEHNGMPEVTA